MFQSLLVATSEMNATTSQQKAKQCQEGEMAYLACYPDVMNAVGGGGFESGWDHYIQFGRKEGRIWQCLEISPEGGISGRCERPIGSAKDAT